MKKTKLEHWQKGGIILLVISLISLILTLICHLLTKNAHPDAGIVCNIPMIPLLPGVMLFSGMLGQKWRILTLILALLMNVSIGIIVGSMIGVISRKTKKKGGDLFFVFLILIELLIIAVQFIFNKFASWSYLLHYALILTILSYVGYIIYSNMTKK